MKTLMTQLALALALCVPAFAEDALPTLPAGQVELTDVLSPEEIYSEMLGTGEELDLADIDAEDTGTNDPQTYRVYIYVSKARQHLWVYHEGRLVNDYAVTTGLEDWKCPPVGCRFAHTPVGRRHPGALRWEHYSSIYENAPMHRAIQFVGGIYLHATYGANIRNLGRRGSGGCIRQHPQNAEWLFLLVRDNVNRFGRKSVLIEITER